MADCASEGEQGARWVCAAGRGAPESTCDRGGARMQGGDGKKLTSRIMSWVDPGMKMGALWLRSSNIGSPPKLRVGFCMRGGAEPLIGGWTWSKLPPGHAPYGPPPPPAAPCCIIIGSAE